ncbi:MAG: hypothetical protein WCD79_22655 [Chthoniobacteraceae bacterium]
MPSNYLQLESQVLSLMHGRSVSEADFNACALGIYRFQRKNNAPYENYCRHTGASMDLESWREIPAVPQAIFKQFPLRSFPEELTVKTFRTSGTTGEGFGSHHFQSLRLYDEAILHGWDFFKLPRLPQIILAPSPLQSPHSSLSHMMGILLARAKNGSQHFCITDSGALQFDKIRDLISQATEPLLLIGTALSFLHLFEAGSLPHLPSGSFAMETGGYKGSGRDLTKAGLYALFAKHLGLSPDSVINEYGMTELSSQFYTHGLGNPHKASPWLRALVIDPETDREVSLGDTGVLRIFDLANVGSVLAIQTRDLSIRREEGFELIGRDPAALPRGCSRAADEMLSSTTPLP